MTDVTWNPAGDDDTSFGPLTAHNVLGGRAAADAHPAAAVSYDNDVSGLAGDTVQEAIDELATSGGAVASVNGETGVVVLDAGDVGAVPNDAVGLLPGETNRGTWDVAATYAVGDVVFETGSDLYIATAPSTGDQPSLTPGSWDVLDPTGRHVRLGPGATSGDYGTAVGPSATSGDYGTAVGLSATSGDYGTAVGLSATSGDYGTAVGLGATSGDFGTAVGPGATAGDYEVNVANTYRATLDPGDPATPLTATIATGHVDLPETAVATNPAADHQRLIARTDGLYVRDQTGTEVGPLGAAHAASHQDGGSDELALDGSQITTGKVGSARLGTHPGLIDGAWHYLSRRSADLPGSSAYQPGANMLVACLLEIVEDCEISGRWYRTEGGSAGAKARVGLYAVSATTGLPTGSPLLSTPETETAASYRSDTFTAVPMSAGFVWLVAATGHATSGWRGFGAPNEAGYLAVDMGGPSSVLPATRGFTGSATYTGTLPDVTAVSWTASTTMPAPYCRWRIERI